MLKTNTVNFGTHNIHSNSVKVPGITLNGEEQKLMLSDAAGNGIIQVGNTDVLKSGNSKRLFLRTYDTDPNTPETYKDFAVWELKSDGKIFLQNNGSIRSTDTLHVGFYDAPTQTARVSIQDRKGDFVDFHYGDNIVGSFSIDPWGSQRPVISNPTEGVVLRNASHFGLPTITTLQKNDTAALGSLYYDTTTNKFMGKTDQGWKAFAMEP